MAIEEDDSELHESNDEGNDFDPSELANAAVELVADQARNHPLRTIGIAFGVGYVLGGGVPRFALRIAGVAVARAMADAVVRGQSSRLLGTMSGSAASRANGHSRRRTHA